MPNVELERNSQKFKFYDQWIKNVPKVGDVISGTVILKEPRRLFVDLGTFGTGVVYGTEYINSRDKIKVLNPGDRLNVKIVSLENEDGYIEVSLKDADRDETWNRIRTLKQERAILNLPVLEANRGGLIMELYGIRGFLPVSQLSLENYPRVEGGEKEKILERLKSFIGKELRVRILDISPKDGKLIFSEREAKEEDVKMLIEKYSVGDIVEGEVTAVVNFGAFVKFGSPPLEGLIHISEFDYKLVDDPRKYVSIGDPIKAKIISIENNRVSLSLKALKENPWERVLERYERDSVYPGRVLKIIPLGALVELDPEIHGIAEVAQFSNNLELLKQALEPGKTYPFRITSIEPKEKRITLALEKTELA
jgi:small subunit ribosomal protein S1